MTKRMSSPERKKEILKITLSIINEEGFHALTIRNIAEKVGVTEAAIYRHFQNKKEIISDLTDRLFTQDPFNYDREGNNPYQVLYEVMHRQFAQLEANPELTAILFQEDIFREYPEIRSKFNEHRRCNEEAIIKLITSGQKEGIIVPDVEPRIFALLYMGSMRISVLRWRSESFSYSLKAETKSITRELFRLLKGGKFYDGNCD